jgi:hypothetical protein
VPFDESKERKYLQWDSKEFKVAPRLYPRNSEFKVMIPQIFTRAKGPLAASAHEVGTAQVRVLIGCVFFEIVTKSETYHIYRAVLLTI